MIKHELICHECHKTRMNQVQLMFREEEISDKGRERKRALNKGKTVNRWRGKGGHPMQAQREEGTDRAWAKASSTVSLEHETIRGTAGDSQIAKGTDAKPSSQDFVLWTVEHDEGNKGPREAK